MSRHVFLSDLSRLKYVGNENWNSLETPETKLYPWDANSTYIKLPPFFQNMTKVSWAGDLLPGGGCVRVCVCGGL